MGLEKGELDIWLDDLAALAQALENREFSELLDAPQVPVTRKADVIKDALGDSVGPLALNLVSLLSSRNVAHLVSEIAEQYQRLLDAHRGIEQAEVISAVVLNDEQRQRIELLLREIVGRDVRLTSRVQPQILGGLVARVGDRVIDGSTKTKLLEMRRQLVG